MRTTQDYEVGAEYAVPTEPRGAGWVLFATIMLGLTALWNFFDGIAAISSAHVYVDNASFVFSDLETWGWIVLILGIIQGFAALVLMSGSEFGRWAGIVSAGVNAVGQLMFMPAYPLWGLAIFAVDVLIIWSLAMYGGAKLRAA